MRIPPEIEEEELGIYYTFSSHDLEIINRHRRDHNRLGFAVQLGIIRHRGWTLTDIKEIPERVLRYIASQLKVDSAVFSLYAKREQTRREHMQEIREEYGYQSFSPRIYLHQSRELLQHALENDNTMHLIREAIDSMRKKMIILPGITTIERMVWETRDRAERRIFRTLSVPLSLDQKEKLDALLVTRSDRNTTPLAWLRQDPGQSSPEAFNKILKRLEYLRQINLQVDSHSIHPRRLRQLARMGSRYDTRAFRRFDEQKRYAILVAYLLDLTQELTDQAIEINDRIINKFHRKGRQAQEEIMRLNGKALNEKLIRFVDLATILLEAKSKGQDLEDAIQSYTTWEQLARERDEAKSLARPVNYDYLDLLKDKFRNLRKYTPTLLEKLEFHSTEAAKPLLEALDTIREMNSSGKRKVPEDAPLEFVPKRWQNHVITKEGTVDKTYYEMAALTKLRDLIRSGDISVVGSRKYKDLEEYFISKSEWQKAKETGTRLLPALIQPGSCRYKTSFMQPKMIWYNTCWRTPTGHHTHYDHAGALMTIPNG